MKFTFCEKSYGEKNNLFKTLMKSKISDNKCHNIDLNNQNDKIQESAPSELRYTTTNIIKNKKDNINKINNNNNNYNQNISAKRILTKKSTMTTLITAWQTTSILIVGMKATTKIT